MRRVPMQALALLAILALVAPAAAAKGGKPGTTQPSPLKVGVEAVDVTNHADMYWINAAGDEVMYRVTVESTEAGSISDALGSNAAFSQGTTEFLRGPYTVTSADITGDTLDYTVTATAGSAVKSGTSSLPIELQVPCPVGSSWEVPLNDKGSAADCNWVPGDPGVWQLTLSGIEARRGVFAGIRVRDHGPGNWCRVPLSEAHDGNGDGFIDGTDVAIVDDDGDGLIDGTGLSPDRWRGGSVDVIVFLPTDGVCLAGGAGGTTVGVGNTSDFLVSAGPNGTVTTELLWPLP